MNNDKDQNNNAVILAGCEDGSILMTEMAIPEHQDDQQRLRKQGSGNDNDLIISHKERVHMHKDSVTSIKQRPEYKFQFLTTSLDGDAILSLTQSLPSYITTSSTHSFELITEFSGLFSNYTNCMYEEGIGYATWMSPNCFIAKNSMYGHLVVQDVREGQSKPCQQVYTTECKINDMSLAFPYMALACDDGQMPIIDLRKVDIDRTNNLCAINSVFKENEA